MEKPSHTGPPAFAKRLLQWYCKPELVEMIEGDIEEEFYNRAEHQGLKKARLIYIMDVLRFFKPFATKKIININKYAMGMNSNYLKVAIRGFKNDKTNMVLSLVGLVVSLVCSMIIYTVVDYQLSFDSFHEKSGHIYRINYDETNHPRSDRVLATVGPPLGPAIKEFYPEVKDAVRFRYTPNQIVSYKETQFYEDKIFYADPSLFNVFTFPLKKGNPDKALTKKDGIVLTSPMAEKYFGDTDPLGQFLEVGEETLEVTGVFEEIPKNLHLAFDFIRPFDAFEVPYGYPVTLDDWGWISFHTYVLLEEGTNAIELENKLYEFAKTHFEEDRIKLFQYKLQAVEDIYFGGIIDEENQIGNYAYVYALSCVGILLIILAAFNFTNISTAKSLTRSLETGIRKTLGSSRNALWWRYLFEPLLLTLFAVTVAFVLLPYLLEQTSNFLQIDYTWNSDMLFELISIFVPLAVLIGILSGLYPAFVMSSFNPVTVLKGSMQTGKKGSLLRTTLVTVQFAITSALLIGSFIVTGQINFMLDKDLGFEKDELAVLQMPGEVLTRYQEPLKQTFLQNPNVLGIAIAGGRMDGDTGSGPVSVDGFDDPVPMAINAIGDEFFKIIGVKLIAGKEFANTSAYDSAHGVILNESAIKVFNLTPGEAIGKKIRVSDQRTDGVIIGVVENFHFKSLHSEIDPLALVYPHTRLRDMYVRVKSGNLHDVIVSLEQNWKTVIPEVPFDLTMLDDHLQSLYKSDLQFAGMVRIFSWITIVISIVGLYGLITLICKYRMKEIGIRKVLGASVNSIVFILSRNFIFLILVANLITWPIIYYLSSSWMDSFAYQQGFDLSYYFIGLMLTLFVALLTLLIQTFKSATRNPINVIRMD